MNPRLKRLPFLLVAVATATGYLLQLASPLRLNNDAESYLVMACSARDGLGFTWFGEPTHFPPGYPAAVSLLDRAGLASSGTIILLNLVALALGLWAWWHLQRRAFTLGPIACAGVCLATLLAWPMLKHATLPVSESLYTGLSLAALLLIQIAHNRRGVAKLLPLLVGALLGFAAIRTRTVGVALLPALGLALLPPGFLDRHSRRIWPLLAAAGLAALLLIAIASRTMYGREMLEQFRLTHPLQHLSDKLLDFGELALNLPASKLPGALTPAVRLAGVAVPVLAAIGLWRRRRLDPVAAYALAYAAIMLIWPYHDSRFWVPVLPLLGACVVNAVTPLLAYRVARPLAALYATAFVAAGLLALAHTTHLSWSGRDFADRYAGGALRATYRAAYGIPADPSDTTPVNPTMLGLLQHFDSRAANPD